MGLPASQPLQGAQAPASWAHCTDRLQAFLPLSLLPRTPPSSIEALIGFRTEVPGDFTVSPHPGP